MPQVDLTLYLTQCLLVLLFFFFLQSLLFYNIRVHQFFFTLIKLVYFFQDFLKISLIFLSTNVLRVGILMNFLVRASFLTLQRFITQKRESRNLGLPLSYRYIRRVFQPSTNLYISFRMWDFYRFAYENFACDVRIKKPRKYKLTIF